MMILQQQLDVLFYADLGMHKFTYALAFSRLAPVQCLTWGHSVTSGVPAIDYYISSAEFENESAQKYYSEELVRLPTSASAYERPSLQVPKRRADFNLPEDAHLYGCLQTLFKFHPDFDALIAGVLRRDPRALLVLVEGPVARWKELLVSRFTKTMGDMIDRVRWLPPLAGADFFAVTALCDVMLDPLHFGGCTTSCEAFAFGVPVVTLPGSLLPGRFTQGFYRRMEIDDCVVTTPEQYVDLAVELGTNQDRRREISKLILSRCNVLFDNSAGVRALEEFFASAIESR
jgi:predicted O-linked N-acetylglucosamine transferase (SPINDLY family)